MDLKHSIKKIIGLKNTYRLRTLKSHLKYHIYNREKHNKIDLYSDCWSLKQTISVKDKHVFFGYYDLKQINAEGDKLIYHELNKNAVTNKDKIKIYWYDLINKESHFVTESSAWSWQQGCRLRWHPHLKDTIILNNTMGNKYVTEVYNIQTKQKIAHYPMAFYDIDNNFHYGISINFSRLQRLRPGYGYATLPDRTINDLIPQDDGIWRYDIRRGNCKLLVSIENLARKANSFDKWNYINHISFSPDGKRIMFFHIWTTGPMEHWKLNLYVIDVEGTNLRCLESQQLISHYCWRNNNELLTTTVGFGGARSYYNIYDTESGKKTVIKSSHLTHDGHPSYFPDHNHFIADTYPLDGSMQHVFSITKEGNDYSPICSVYHDDRMYGEKRCDLHPRLSNDGKCFIIDSTCKGGKRSIYLFEKQ